MESGIDYREIDFKIKLLKKTAEELKSSTREFPAVSKNVSRILASLKMLEINVSDAMEMDRKRIL